MDEMVGIMTPTVVFIDNPFGRPMLPPCPIQFGVALRDTKPVELGEGMPVMLKVNGEWLLQVDWDSEVVAGDRVEWHLCPPQGGNASRLILQVVAFIVIAYLTAGIGNIYYQAAARLALGLAATALINAVVPAQSAKVGGNPASPQSVYSVALAGNQARLNAPIPVIYGRHQIFPDFAAMPYSEFSANDQYYHALFCIGQGEYTFERLQIDDTSFSSFPDVWYHILPPGVKPLRVLPNVVTAPEVADQELKTGQAVGGFIASQPQSLANHIGIDIGFANGLASISDSGESIALTVTWQVDYRYVDDFGAPAGGWAVLANESLTLATTTPQRVSNKYQLPTSGRVEIRVTRTSDFVDSARVLNTMSWIGLRAYIKADLTQCLSPTATHLEVRIRASQQLSQLSQRKIGCIVRRKLHTWNPTTGWSPTTVETRSIAWALADVWKDPVYGDGLADSRVDLQTLYDLDLIWFDRQDHLDIVFDSKITSWDAAKTIAQVGRATPFRRYGVCTLARDQYQELPVTAYTSRNIRPNSTSIGYAVATEVTADAVIIEYFSNRIWDWVTITCNAPGVVTAANPVTVRISGITGSKHANREGVYMAAVNMYRRKFPSWETEMLGLLPCYGDTVVFSPTLSLWASTGDVIDWDAGTYEITLSEPAVFENGELHEMRFQRPNGSLTAAIAATSGSAPNKVILEYDPQSLGMPFFAFNTTDPNEDRTKYVFAKSTTVRSTVKIIGISKKDRDQENLQYIQMSAVNEDVRVHVADRALLPAPGEIQDPVDSTSVLDQPETSGHVTHITTKTFSATQADFVAPSTVTMVFHADGTLTAAVFNSDTALTNPFTYPTEWLGDAPVDPLLASHFQVRLRNKVGLELLTITGPGLNVWTSLGSDVTWVFSNTGVIPSHEQGILELRVNGGSVEASTTLYLDFFQTGTGYYDSASAGGDGAAADGASPDADSAGTGAGDGADGTA